METSRGTVKYYYLIHLMYKVFVNDTSVLFIHLQTAPYFSSNTQLFEKKYIRCV